jgi:hypothetical protein
MLALSMLELMLEPMLKGMLGKLEGTIPGSPHSHHHYFLWIIFLGRHRFPFSDTLYGCK